MTLWLWQEIVEPYDETGAMQQQTTVCTIMSVCGCPLVHLCVCEWYH